MDVSLIPDEKLTIHGFQKKSTHIVALYILIASILLTCVPLLVIVPSDIVPYITYMIIAWWIILCMICVVVLVVLGKHFMILTKATLLEDLCGMQGALEGETIRYNMTVFSSRNKEEEVFLFTTILLSILLPLTSSIWIVIQKTGQSKTAFLGMAALLFILIVVCISVLNVFSSQPWNYCPEFESYKKHYATLKEFVAILKNRIEEKKPVPFGFRRLYDILVKRIKVHKSLVSNEETINVMKNMTPARILEYLHLEPHSDSKLILDSLQCSEVFKTCNNKKLLEILLTDDVKPYLPPQIKTIQDLQNHVQTNYNDLSTEQKALTPNPLTESNPTTVDNILPFIKFNRPPNRTRLNELMNMKMYVNVCTECTSNIKSDYNDFGLPLLQKLASTMIALRDMRNFDPTSCLKSRYKTIFYLFLLIILVPSYVIFHIIYKNASDPIVVVFSILASITIIIYICSMFA
jgi:hypothetical protein